MKSIRKIRLIWLAVFAWLGTLLFLSFQTGEGTAATSGRLAVMVSRILSTLGLEASYAMIHGMLRTATHIVVFLIFGGLLEAAVIETMKVTGDKNDRVEKAGIAAGVLWKARGLLIVLLAGAVVAALSEVFKV